VALTAPPAAGARAAGGTVQLDAVRVLFIVGAIGSFTSPPLANIALGLALLGLCAQPSEWWRIARAARQPLGIGALALLLVMAAAMLWADADWRHRFGAWWNWRVLVWLVLASAVFDEARWKERFCLAIVGFLSVAAVVSFVVRLLPVPPILLDDPGVILRNHVTQGMAFAAGTLLAVALAFARPYTAWTRRLLLAAAAAFVANLLLISGGRSGHVALLVCAAAGALMLLQGRRRWLAALMVPVVAGLLASSALVRERFEMAYRELGTVATSPQETSIGLRLVIWSTTVDLIRQRPLLGYGVGGFAPAYARLVHERYSDWHAAEATDTHNQYLHLMVEAGLPGLAAFIAFVVGALRQASSQPYRGCGLALLAAWLATSLFNSHFQTFNEGHMIALLLGALLGFEGGGPVPGSANAADTAAATSA
jgi:O-antigen ligase